MDANINLIQNAEGKIRVEFDGAPGDLIGLLALAALSVQREYDLKLSEVLATITSTALAISVLAQEEGGHIS